LKRLMLFMLLAGTALLAFVVSQTDLGEVWQQLRDVGPAGVVALFGIFLASHAALAASWMLTLPEAQPGPRWLFRLWRVLMVGSAIESVTPLGSLGGDPVKAILLKRHYGIRYTHASASLVLHRMSDLFAQILFIAIGLALLYRTGVLPPAYRIAAGAGLAVFALAIAAFLLAQTQRGFSRMRGWLERGRLGRRLGQRAVSALDGVRQVEDRLVSFYRARRGRLALAVLLAFGEWTGNALAVWLAVNLLGHPIGLTDALVIEAFLALVRSMFFFVPGDVGTQEAAQVLICGAVTGSPETGLALAALRRARDLSWILWGLFIGGSYSWRDVRHEAAAARFEDRTPAAAGEVIEAGSAAGAPPPR
jgi:uncharacterized protein (TIRG00374 family)